METTWGAAVAVVAGSLVAAGSVAIVDVNAGAVVVSIRLATVVLTITCGFKLPDGTMGICTVVLTKRVDLSSSEDPSVTEVDGMLMGVP